MGNNGTQNVFQERPVLRQPQDSFFHLVVAGINGNEIEESNICSMNNLRHRMHEIENFIQPSDDFFLRKAKCHAACTEGIRIDEKNALFENGQACGKVYRRRGLTHASFRNRYGKNLGHFAALSNEDLNKGTKKTAVLPLPRKFFPEYSLK
jgi:hypothetical protein